MACKVGSVTNSTYQLHSPCVVISQPMYFPWVGMLEQVRLCDIFVHYDDVQFARGFFNRVQVKTNMGMRWLTVPLQDLHRGQLINEVMIDNRTDWRRSHRDLLRNAYANAPCKAEMLGLVDKVFSREYQLLSDLSRTSVMELIRYFDLDNGCSFFDSSTMATPGSSTQRLIDLCLRLNCKTYLTGHGARNYLDHERFEAHAINVAYMNYGLRPYPQSHGAFTPYVTALDLVAHCGKEGVSYITGNIIPWREFITTKKDI